MIDFDNVVPNDRDRSYAADRRRRAVLVRDGHQCAFLFKNGKRCRRTEELEVDHILPVKLGGEDKEENMQTLCKKHHMSKTIEDLEKMRRIKIYKKLTTRPRYEE